jgi:nucleoside-diphosphate-sugar epimerase
MAGTARDLVTGGTGLLGSHIAERLVGRGRRVRALVRARSDTAFLESLDVELARGDLTEPGSLAEAVRGVDTVYHSAAKVGDWGQWQEFQACCVDATRNLAEAASRAGVNRFLHISSTSAYGHPDEGGPPIDESAPMGQNLWVWDPYTRSKVESERALWSVRERTGLPVTVIRPSWLYGERDRTTTARVVEQLRKGRFALVGRGDNPLSAIYAGTVADAALLAAADPASAGEAYNITHQGRITQREFFDLFAEAAGVPAVRRRLPYGFVYGAAFLLEAFFRMKRRLRPPMITRYATWLMGRNLEYSTAKAEQRLGWRPDLTYRESIERTVRWYLGQGGSTTARKPSTSV